MTRAIGKPFSAAERLQFVQAARELLGVRWRHQGRSSRGVDCGGLVAYALAAVGCAYEDSVGYPRLPYRGTLEALMKKNFGDPLPKASRQFGDVILMRFNNSAPCHVGILGDYLHEGELSIIHAFAQNKKVVEHRLSSEWVDYATEVYRP